MEENLSGMNLIDYSIDSELDSGINAPEFLAAVEDFAEWAKAQPEVSHVNTITETIKKLNKNMHGDDSSYYKIPENRELAAQYLLMYEMSLPYGLDLNNQINVPKSGTRLTVTMYSITTQEIIDFNRRAIEHFKSFAPNIKISAASPTLMFADIGQRNLRSMLIGTSIGMVAISILLIFALRSFKFGALSILPNVTPALVAFGVWGMTVAEVGLALSIIASMSLGIVVDDTVHFLSKYLHARRHKDFPPTKAVEYAFQNVGRALLITTMVLVVGFMVLAQSTFMVNALMGLMTAFTIFLALVIDFSFLPALLMKADSKSLKEELTDEVKTVVA